MTVMIIEPRFGDLDLFRQYLEDIERFLDDEAQRYRERLEELGHKRHEAMSAMSKAIAAGEEIVPPPPDQHFQEEAEEYYHYEQMEMMDKFASILRRSFFASLYGFLESWLVAECRCLRSDDILLDLQDISGRGIDQARVYLAKVLRISFPFDTSREWNEIKDYQKLRNCIVHGEGKPSNERLRHYIDRKDTLSLSVYDEDVILHKGFCEEVLDTIERFFDALLHFIADQKSLSVIGPAE